MIATEVNITDKILHYIGKQKKGAFVVQIGAMDGESFDDIVGYIDAYDWDGLYVEPIPYYFNKLVRRKKITDLFEQSAIVSNDGPVEMITIDRAPIETSEIHIAFSGMSAVWPPRNGLSHPHDIPTAEKHGKKIIANGITLNTLFKKHSIEKFDIFLCDAEGYDGVVFKQIDLEKYRPKFIRLEWINLTEEEQSFITKTLDAHNYVYEIFGQDINAVSMEFWNEYINKTSPSNINLPSVPVVTEEPNLKSQLKNLLKQVDLKTALNLLLELSELPQNETDTAVVDIKKSTETKKLTIVTGLWNIGRENITDDFKRPYSHYLDKFAELLKTPSNMYIYISKEDEEFIWKHRSRKNTFVKILELDELKEKFPFFEEVQSIRKNDAWKNQASWLKTSPQATLEYYNPVVMNKMFWLHDAALSNPFDSEYFYWIDAGICSTVHPGYFYHDLVFENLPKFSEAVGEFVFLSYPYEGNTEIHGFDRDQIAKYSKTDYVRYVCRGGFFGGKKEHIQKLNGYYYGLLNHTLSNNLMGTEESLFTIIAHRYPESIYRFELDYDGMVWPFFEKLKDVDHFINNLPPKKLSEKTAKVNLYVLTFNSPKQFQSMAESIINADEEMYTNSRKILINNSTDRNTFEEYDRLCKKYSFEEIHKDNLGVCGGRQFAAEHFDNSDANFYMFFEDDMFLNSNDMLGEFCRNGFRKYIPNLYKKLLKIMLHENFDFLKFSFSEFYGDNSVQWAWYNVPQHIRTEVWPNYDKLPESGLDPNTPKTQFNFIEVLEETPYIKGEIYYSNWPQIVSRSGNKKMFLDVKWDYPYEQTWMSHIFQLTKQNEIKSAVLLASPVTHDRFEFYKDGLRKES